MTTVRAAGGGRIAASFFAFVHDAEAAISAWSHGAERLLGYQAHEALGRGGHRPPDQGTTVRAGGAASRLLPRELERWGSAVGAYLSARGYSRPYGIDALIDADGMPYATESNVRRTATTTPQAMIDRLARAAGVPGPARLLASGPSRSARTFTDFLRLLRAERLAWDTGRGEGALLYGDAPADGRTWRCAVIGADLARVAELRTAPSSVMALPV
ncbi:peptide ligase PGM1-related protein [Streptomyces sp. NPDC002133]|uniref:peptide ligase PGM1-related protein n=1 Tax=Streptomyces sp. NPDC002133 TaxID=3154409 RepID=UPI00332D7EA1